jgi:hypothetical protein
MMISMGREDQKEARAWWKDKFGWDLLSSTCSDILSVKWQILDEGDSVALTKHKLAVKRNHIPKWETLEAVLIEWQIRYDQDPNSGPTTSDLL